MVVMNGMQQTSSGTIPELIVLESKIIDIMNKHIIICCCLKVIISTTVMPSALGQLNITPSCVSTSIKKLILD